MCRPLAAFGVLLFSLWSQQASGQSPVQILTEGAGYRLGVAQNAESFSVDRFEAGLRGTPIDSTERDGALGLRVRRALTADTLRRPDLDRFLEGVRGAVERRPPPYTWLELRRADALLQDSIRTRQLEREALTSPSARETLERVRAAQEQSVAFLAEAAREPEAQRTESGIVYRIIEAGSGASPSYDGGARVTYVGRLPDGTDFDRSPEGETSEFGLFLVVVGLAEMLVDMSLGERRLITIPAALAFGLQGGGPIPPGTAVQFDLTLVEVLERPPVPPPPQPIPPGR